MVYRSVKMCESSVMDVLSDLIGRARAHGAVFADTTVHGTAWGIRFRPAGDLGLHYVLAGAARLRAGRQDHHLVGGDLAVVRQASSHSLAGSTAASSIELERFVGTPGVRRGPRTFVAEGAGSATRFVCGSYTFRGDLCTELLAELPDVMVLRPEPGTILASTLTLLATEIGTDRPGQQVVLDRLLDVALVAALREQFSTATSPRWYAAMADPVAGAALRRIHDDPAATHTLRSLAAAAHVSRTTLAQRFADLVGVPPLTYLTRWRLALAREQLRDTDAPLDAIARTVGYGSGYALASAFKREYGQPPGRWRRSDPADVQPSGSGRQ
jgi:AraC-like DNA-binding protein